MPKKGCATRTKSVDILAREMIDAAGIGSRSIVDAVKTPPLTANLDHSEKCSAGACPLAKCRPAGHDHNEECRAGTRPHPWASRPANRQGTKSP